MDRVLMYLRKIYSKLPVIAFDIGSIPVAWFFASWLRNDMNIPPHFFAQHNAEVLLLLSCIQTICFYHFKVYRGLWRFSSIKDVIRIMKATLTASIVAVPAFYAVSLWQYVPRSVLVLYSIVLMTILCGVRLYCRQQLNKPSKDIITDEEIKRVLIIGAGQAGESLIRDLKRTHAYLPIGVVDDSKAKRGQEVHGVRVLGTIPKLPELVEKHQPDLIFIAIPSAGSAAMRRIVNYCKGFSIPFHTLPSLQALAEGQVEVNALRKVNIEDLLGRDQVQLHWDKIASSIYGQRVLVTGGGGSIGSELCRQIMSIQPSKLLILDNCEFNLYNIEQELTTKFPNLSIEMALVSVTDETAIKHVFEQFRPQLVFHAAAFKHVPMLEDQIRVAVLNNVVGTQIVAQATVAVKAEKFILISTDKAVNPTNVMGTTKRVAEIYCQNLNARVNTQFITVRFGNVLGSQGSVVPLFQQQLQKGGPLTVTHPDIQRYFMTIPEASQLILQAMVNGDGGEIFVLDMGEPIKISYLAEQMIRLAGKTPGKDISIQYTGLRPGEKLYEELFHASEHLAETEHAKLFKAQFRKIDWAELTQTIRMINAACQNHQSDELLVLLKSLVPEFNCRLMTDIDVDQNA